MNKNTRVLGALLAIIVLVFLGFRFLSGDEDTWICGKSGWEKHGNPSAPAPTSICITDNKDEDLKNPEALTCGKQGGKQMRAVDAVLVVENGPCKAVGPIKGTFQCNAVTGTWWYDLNASKEGCNPACVVNTDTGTSEVNWRCTGLKLPTE